MPVLYDSKKLIPVERAQIRKIFNKNEDGLSVGAGFEIVVEGKLVVDKGSPNSSGVFWDASDYPPDENITSTSWLGAILRKQEAMRQLFANEGRTLEIQGYDGTAPIKCNPRLRGPIEFLPPGQGRSVWTNYCDYRIVFEADILYLNGTSLGEDESDLTTYHIERYDETWQLEPGDDLARTYRLSHQLSAKGKRFYDETGTLTQQAWENARDYVTNKLLLGLDNTKMAATGVLNNSNFGAFNYVRSQTVNESAGTFSVGESWLCFEAGTGYPAIEEFSVSTRIGEGNLSNVTVEGTIRGLEVKNNTSYALTSTRWFNASGKFTEVEPVILARAQNFGGVQLNPTILNKVVGRNEIQGTVTYSYEYNNRPTSAINGAISEIISINYDNQADLFAVIPVIGRAAGPVLQDLLSKTERGLSVSIEAVLPASTITTPATKPDTNTLVSGYAPSFTSFRKTARDNEQWVDRTGRYSRNISWIYE